MNEDLRRERSKATFNVEKMTHLLLGGEDRARRQRELQEIIARDPTGIFSNEDNCYLHRTDRHVRAVAKAVRMVELCRKLGIGDSYNGQMVHDPDFSLLLKAIGDDLPLALHYVMFVPNIVSLCDDEQQKRWLPLARDWKMIGCYAQTELGHGSNVRGLETTATFKSASQGSKYPDGSWVINSPTITSGKFWPGTLGKNANHAMVIARLIDGQGRDQGMHNFLVQLRSMKDHSLLEGVKTGDIGPKIGYNNMDNGYCYFDNVEIPRRNMAMRFSTVDENGRYSKTTDSKAASKVAYITMMQVRALITASAGEGLGFALTIATRYAAVRRQGYAPDGKTERSILDYKQQQHRLFSNLACSYGFMFSGWRLVSTMKETERCLTNNEPISKMQVSDLHASSSCLKSFSSMTTADGLEDLRRSCGGHGFLLCSGIPEFSLAYLQNPTVEGDNHMLPQQVVKVLLKLVQAVQTGESLRDYIPCDCNDLVQPLRTVLRGQQERCGAQNVQGLMHLNTLLEAFRYRAAYTLAGVAAQIQRMTRDEGKPYDMAWNDSLVEMSRCSRSYAQFLLLRNFINGIEKRTNEKVRLGPAETSVLRDLARLFGSYWMEREMGDFMECGYISTEQAKMVRANVLKLLDTIRPNAVPLVDAWDISDFRLKSALGRYDGDVYPAIMAAAKRDPLNMSDISPAYKDHLRKLTVEGVGAFTPARL